MINQHDQKLSRFVSLDIKPISVVPLLNDHLLISYQAKNEDENRGKLSVLDLKTSKLRIINDDSLMVLYSS